MSKRRFLLPLVGLATVVLFASADAASAHIEPDTATVAAGEPVTVGFELEHGCGDQPTTQLAIQVPESVTDAQPVPIDGWESSVVGRTVTFAGGPQPAHEALTISLMFTAPDADGASLTFPMVQTCGATEIAWISTTEGADRPAPTLVVGPSGAPAGTGSDHHDTDAGEHQGSTDTTVAALPTAATGSEPAESSKAPLIIGGLILVLAVGTVIIVVRTRGRSTT